MNFVDAHCHLHFDRITKLLPTIIQESIHNGINHFVVNSTSPADFDSVLKIHQEYPNITPCFGIHPYFIQESSIESSLESLSKLCNQLKINYCIGEIGMDKTRISICPLSTQEMVFRKQIQLAQSRSVPFIVHCVKCIGSVYEVLKSELHSPFPFLMHGYSGSPDFVNKIVKLGGYFSISNYFLNLSPKRKKQMEDTIRAIPFDRLLFESDAPDMVEGFGNS